MLLEAHRRSRLRAAALKGTAQPLHGQQPQTMEVTMRFQIYAREDGRYEVIDVTTLQVRYVGSAYGAMSAQAQLNAEHRRRVRSH